MLCICKLLININNNSWIIVAEVKIHKELGDILGKTSIINSTLIYDSHKVMK